MRQRKILKIYFSPERVIRSGRKRRLPVRNRKMEPFGRNFNYCGRIFSRS